MYIAYVTNIYIYIYIYIYICMLTSGHYTTLIHSLTQCPPRDRDLCIERVKYVREWLSR